MSSSDDSKPGTVITPKRAEARAERERRLAEALRENLKRRKEQSRGRAEPPGERSGRSDEEK
jgi:hypothetical protein